MSLNFPPALPPSFPMGATQPSGLPANGQVSPMGMVAAPFPPTSLEMPQPAFSPALSNSASPGLPFAPGLPNPPQALNQTLGLPLQGMPGMPFPVGPQPGFPPQPGTGMTLNLLA